MTIITSGTTFLLSFVVVWASTYIATAFFTSESSLGKSAVTALITSLIWSGVTYIISGTLQIGGYWVALGPLLAVICYILFIDFSYEGGLGRAVAISIGNWVVSFAILYAAAYFGYSSFQAIGVPPGL